MIDNSFESRSQWRGFIEEHKKIDEGIELRRAKNKLINKVFLIIDSVLVVLILCIQGILEYNYRYSPPSSDER